MSEKSTKPQTNNETLAIGIDEQVNTLPDELIQWQARLLASGVNVIDVAYTNMPLWGTKDFTEDSSEANDIWAEQKQRITISQPVSLSKAVINDEQLLMVGCLVAELADDNIATIACLVQPPYDEKTMGNIQLSLGWLYYYFANADKAKGDRAQKLMELFSYVLSQTQIREAAQEWINRTAVWARATTNDNTDLSLLLFQIKNSTPKWWVASNLAYVERGSPILQKASELAARTMVEAQEQSENRWWSFPLINNGYVTAVLVMYQDDNTPVIADPAKDVLRASSSMAEPILRNWQNAEQPLWVHGKKSSTSLLKKLFGAGHLTLKVFSTLALLLLLFITLYPVDDIVTADLYVEGDSRWIVTSPQQGFLATAHVRAGDHVKKGDVLARLEDKDLKLELAELTSEIEQADSQFRKAMAEVNAAESGLAINQKKQAQTKLALVQQKLNRINIVAPMNGLVVSGDWSQQIGVPLEAGKELFQIADDSKYRLVLHVLDKDIDEVSVSQKGKLRLTSLPDTTYEFQVTRITSIATVDDGKNGFKVEAKLLSDTISLNPGMEGIGKVTVGRTNYISLWTASFIDWLRLKVWSIW